MLWLPRINDSILFAHHRFIQEVERLALHDLLIRRGLEAASDRNNFVSFHLWLSQKISVKRLIEVLCILALSESFVDNDPVCSPEKLGASIPTAFERFHKLGPSWGVHILRRVVSYNLEVALINQELSHSALSPLQVRVRGLSRFRVTDPQLILKVLSILSHSQRWVEAPVALSNIAISARTVIVVIYCLSRKRRENV